MVEVGDKAGNLAGIVREKEGVVLLFVVGALVESTPGTFAGGRPVGRSCPEKKAVHGIPLDVHDVLFDVVFDLDGDASLRRAGQDIAGLVTPVVHLDAVAIDPDDDAAPGGSDDRLGQLMVGEGVHGDVEGALGRIDEGQIDGFEVFGGGVVFPQKVVQGSDPLEIPRGRTGVGMPSGEGQRGKKQKKQSKKRCGDTNHEADLLDKKEWE